MCRPTTLEEEGPCARQIVENLATRAYRREVEEAEVDGILSFYEAGYELGGFERGIRDALEAILASPFFVLRLEPEPAGDVARGAYELAGPELASRLSFFLWGTPPDEELLALAESGELRDPADLRAQAVRMLADPRAEVLLLETLTKDPSGPAAPAAELELAKLYEAAGRSPDALDRVEHLILTFPESAVVPEARRLLDHLRGTVPRT